MTEHEKTEVLAHIDAIDRLLPDFTVERSSELIDPGAGVFLFRRGNLRDILAQLRTYIQTDQV